MPSPFTRVSRVRYPVPRLQINLWDLRFLDRTRHSSARLFSDRTVCARAGVSRTHALPRNSAPPRARVCASFLPPRTCTLPLPICTTKSPEAAKRKGSRRIRGKGVRASRASCVRARADSARRGTAVGLVPSAKIPGSDTPSHGAGRSSRIKGLRTYFFEGVSLMHVCGLDHPVSRDSLDLSSCAVPPGILAGPDVCPMEPTSQYTTESKNCSMTWACSLRIVLCFGLLRVFF